MPQPQQLLPQLPVVVDLAIEDDRAAAVERGHGLMPGWRQIEYGQAPEAQPHWTRVIAAAVVRPAMKDDLCHALDHLAVGRRPVYTQHSCKTAHTRLSHCRISNAASGAVTRGYPRPTATSPSVEPMVLTPREERIADLAASC